MSVKKQVFGSFSERENYYKLSREWGKRYRIYHNLPFLMIFDLDSLSNQYSQKEIAYLKTTSIDYTLCDYSDKPILCIEFDGLCQGFSVGNKYYSEDTTDTLRWKKLNLKLKIADSNWFQFFIVSSKHFSNLSKSLKLSIVDGIIGTAISVRAIQDYNQRPERQALFQELFRQVNPPPGKTAIVKWGYDSDEIKIIIEKNPIYKKVNELEETLEQYKDKIGQIGYSYCGFFHPKDVDFDAVTHIGMECGIHSEKIGVVRSTALMPNVYSRWCPGFDLVGEIARLLVLDKFIKILRGECPPPRQKILGTIYFD